MAHHIALLGDSIFDNRAYTGGQADVIGHLRTLLPMDWTATLAAIDGSTIEDIDEQLAALPPDVERAVLSVGGNDALLNADILDRPVVSTREALQLFAVRANMFEIAYQTMLGKSLERVPTLTVCTIYNGNLAPDDASVARVALMLFNDVILRAAFTRGLDVIDLRLVCTEPDDYANPIEPSGHGGRKIAETIASALGLNSATTRRTRAYTG